MTDIETPKQPAEGRNYQLIFWSGSLATIGGQLVNPNLVLPFLYLGLGGTNVFFAGLLLPFVTGSRLIAEIFHVSVYQPGNPRKACGLRPQHP